jgi:hypothetical protein
MRTRASLGGDRRLSGVNFTASEAIFEDVEVP